MSTIFGAVGALILKRPDGVYSEPEVESEAPPPPASKGTVLVIDDDLSMLETLRPLLSQAGYTVLTAPSGAKGLDLLRYAKKDVRVVLLDYHMPRLSGTDTLQYLRKLAPGAKVVALSGVAPELLPEAFRTSTDRFIAKPFRAADLMRAVDELVEIDLPNVAA